jgi:glucosamine--fructose-6-phosphate aminotransferase (isomerizing)
MCGIVAYTGFKNSLDVLLEGLTSLEYRGYDSAGVGLMTKGGDLEVIKVKGKVANLKKLIPEGTHSHSGIGHTRWATHGEPNTINAHPHFSNHGKLCLIHNGIIENYSVLKDALIDMGSEFKSSTDTEVLAHLIEQIMISQQVEIVEAISLALKRVDGAFAIAILHKDYPNKIFGARRSSPLVLGIGDGELILASDASPIIKYTEKVIYINDDEIVTLDKDGSFEINNLDSKKVDGIITILDMKLEELEKGGFKHFMQKEIFQQAETVRHTMRGRLDPNNWTTKLGGLHTHIDKFINARRIIFIACGTSWHSALIAEYIIEDLLRIPVEVEYASEFRYRNPILYKDDIVIPISQSGETADTLAALGLANDLDIFTYGLVNVVGSSIARETDAGSYLHAGPEIGVASTKAFTSQVTLIVLLSLHLARLKKVHSEEEIATKTKALYEIPNQITEILKLDDSIREIAYHIHSSTNALYLGRGINFPVALEGALKLKEISYIHAEGYPAAEMKHGPIALIDENMPVIVLANNVNSYDKIVSNIQEVKARKAKVIAIVSNEYSEISKIADYIIPIPETIEILSPLLAAIPLQLLAYHIAEMRKCDIDQPRNLAKSVTVE